MNGVLATCWDSINLEASDGLSLGSPGNGDGCLGGICHTGPARGTNICTRRKRSPVSTVGIANLTSYMFVKAFAEALYRALLLTERRISASASSKALWVICGGSLLTFKSGDHPLGWSTGQRVLQGIDAHFILGCHLEQTKLYCVMRRTWHSGKYSCPHSVFHGATFLGNW